MLSAHQRGESSPISVADSMTSPPSTSTYNKAEDLFASSAYDDRSTDGSGYFFGEVFGFFAFHGEVVINELCDINYTDYALILK